MWEKRGSFLPINKIIFLKMNNRYNKKRHFSISRNDLSTLVHTDKYKLALIFQRHLWPNSLPLKETDFQLVVNVATNGTRILQRHVFGTLRVKNGEFIVVALLAQHFHFEDLFTISPIVFKT